MEEFQLQQSPSAAAPIHGSSLVDLDIGRRTKGALVLAIQGGSGLIANPNGETVLQAGQRLIVMGSPLQLQALEQLLGDALESATVIRP